MGCCKKFIKKISSAQAVLCLRWVLPLRIIAIGSLCANCCVLFFLIKNPSPLWLLGTVFQVAIAILLLKECKRSVDYHNLLRNKGELNQ
jgi:hypothetical protein